jgi:hypothetical protein
MKRARDEFRFVNLEAREDDSEGEDEGDEENEDDVSTSARI